MICPSCIWEADTRKREIFDVKELNTILEIYYVGHQACRGGTWCDCEHKISERVTDCE